MPSGKTHDKITIGTAPIVASLSYGLFGSFEISFITTSAHVFSGLMFGPDLDVKSLEFTRWGIFRFFWIPYQKLIPHRSPLSHAPIIGTLIRFLYVGIILIIGCFFLNSFLYIINSKQNVFIEIQDTISILWKTMVREKHIVFSIFFGTESGAFSHYTSDFIVSKWKRKTK